MKVSTKSRKIGLRQALSNSIRIIYKNEPKKTNTQAPRKIDAIYLTVNLKTRGVRCFGFEIWTNHHQDKSH